MAYRKFETKNAEYVLGLMNHDWDTNLASALENKGYSKAHGLDRELFKDVDGLVVEDAGEGMDAVVGAYLDAGEHEFIYGMADPRHPLVFDVITREIPFYGTDIEFGYLPQDTERRVQRRVDSRMIEAFHRTCEDNSKELYSSEELNSGTQWFNQLGYYLICEPNIEGRNAINAAKIEDFVVNRVRQYSGKDRPKIGLVYGAAHVGVENCLRSIRRRNKVIRKMRKFEGFDAEKFNLLQEAILKDKQIRIRQFNTHCF